jgi:hypothetical protein
VKNTGGDQEFYLAILYDVFNLLFLENRVDKHKYSPGHGYAKHGYKLLGGLIEEYTNPVPCPDAQMSQEGLQFDRLLTEIAKGNAAIFVLYSDLVLIGNCAISQEMVD